MRRLLIIVLLAVLPAQFCWAAASAYCRHESGEASKHFGHHEHQHRAASDSAAKDAPASSSGQTDNDCGTCQLSTAQPVPPAMSDLPAPDTDPPGTSWSAKYASHIPSGPERPDRCSFHLPCASPAWS